MTKNTSNKITSIQLKQETKDALASVGSKGDTYDAIVRRLLLHYDKKIKFK